MREPVGVGPVAAEAEAETEDGEDAMSTELGVVVAEGAADEWREWW